MCEEWHAGNSMGNGETRKDLVRVSELGDKLEWPIKSGHGTQEIPSRSLAHSCGDRPATLESKTTRWRSASCIEERDEPVQRQRRDLRGCRQSGSRTQSERFRSHRETPSCRRGVA